MYFLGIWVKLQLEEPKFYALTSFEFISMGIVGENEVVTLTKSLKAILLRILTLLSSPANLLLVKLKLVSFGNLGLLRRKQ